MLKSVIKKYQTWTRRRQLVAELSSLTDRDLLDIGIRRWQIEEIVDQEMARRGE